MTWIKKGLVFDATKQLSWAGARTMLPVSLELNDVIRVYYCSRDTDNTSSIGFVDLYKDDLTKIVNFSQEPILSAGKLGCFDDSGVLPSAVIKEGNVIYLYYLGYNIRKTVLHSNAIGLAVSFDNGLTFNRKFEGPIVDRTRLEPYFALSCDVLKDEDGTWHMWYTSGTGWELINDKPEQQYHIKYASSKDGEIWKQDNISAIIPEKELEAIGRPTVIKENGLYKMWYIYRGSHDYRNGSESYRIGYAESENAINWVRKDNESGIDFSDSGWDSAMLSYPYVRVINGKKIMFYNGNGFGIDGFGIAVWDEEKIHFSDPQKSIQKIA